MNLYKYVEEKVKLGDIEHFEDDAYELAIVRYVLKEVSPLFFRDITFFLNKEEINQRQTLYNKKANPEDIEDFSIVCKSYCEIIREILKNVYGIKAELISPYKDALKHVDLLITTKKGKRYIIDPLMDLEKMQVRMKTDFFASKKKFDSSYSGKLEDISFITDEELKSIDDSIHYTIKGMYTDDLLEKIRQEFSKIGKTSKEEISLDLGLPAKENNGKDLSEDEKLEMKIDFISDFLNNRRYMNSIVDFMMYLKLALSKVFTEDELKKIKLRQFFVDDIDIKDEELNELFLPEDSRKRGVILMLNGKCYAFSLKPEIHIKTSKDRWNKLVENNNIYVRPVYPVVLLEYLKKVGADRNIVHHNEFLRLFNRFEQQMFKEGYQIDDIKKYVDITEKIIRTKYGEIVEYRIENGNLVVYNVTNGSETTIIYKDEGRSIEHISTSKDKEDSEERE